MCELRLAPRLGDPGWSQRWRPSFGGSGLPGSLAFGSAGWLCVFRVVLGRGSSGFGFGPSLGLLLWALGLPGCRSSPFLSLSLFFGGGFAPGSWVLGPWGPPGGVLLVPGSWSWVWGSFWGPAFFFCVWGGVLGSLGPGSWVLLAVPGGCGPGPLSGAWTILLSCVCVSRGVSLPADRLARTGLWEAARRANAA